MRLHLRSALLAFLVVALAVTVFVLTAPASYATDTNRIVKRGDVCDQIGQLAYDRSGDEYVCKQKPSDPCPRFHSTHPGRGGDPLPPCVCPSKSPSKSPSPKPSASKSPATSASPTKPPSSSPSTTTSQPGPAGSTTTHTAPVEAPSTTPVAKQLPITGDSTGYLLGAGALLVAGGVVLLVAASARRRTS